MMDYLKRSVKPTIILSFYVSVTQQQYVATRQYTINAVGQRKKVTAVNRLRCHTLHYPDIYKHPHTHMVWHFMYVYIHARSSRIYTCNKKFETYT